MSPRTHHIQHKRLTSQYLRQVCDPESLATHIERVTRVLLKARTGFDAIAFRGMSGAAVGFPASARTGIPVAIVRSPKASTHSCYPAEGDTSIARYVIVDDFVESGGTVAEIMKALSPAKCAGLVLYADQFQIGGPYDDCSPALDGELLMPVLSRTGTAHPECRVPHLWQWDQAHHWVAAVLGRESRKAAQPSPYSESASP